MRALNLDQLRSLVTVAATGSFSAAARKLNLTQPAVSQQIKDLEARLGVALLDRIGRRALPTPPGADLIDYALRLLDRAEAATAAMAHDRTGRLGRVRLGADATLCAFVLPMVLRRLRNDHPDLSVTVEAGASSALLAKVAANDLDAAFVTWSGAPPAGLTGEVALDDRLIAYWPDLLGPAPAVVRPADLAGRPGVGLLPDNTTHALVAGWLGDHEPAPMMQFDLGSTAAAMAAAGLGIAILPPEVRVLATILGGVTIRPIDPPLARTVQIVTRRNKPMTPALSTTLAALRRIRSVG